MVEISEIIEDEELELELEVESKVNDEIENVVNNELDNEPMLPINNGGITKNYTWTQTKSDVTLFVDLADNTKSRDIKVKFSVNKLSVCIKGETKVEGNLFMDIKIETSTWYLDQEESKNILIIELDKNKENEWWKTVIKGDREIIVEKVTPDNEYIGNLDQETRMTVDKMLFDQRIKEEQKRMMESKK